MDHQRRAQRDLPRWKDVRGRVAVGDRQSGGGHTQGRGREGDGGRGGRIRSVREGLVRAGGRRRRLLQLQTAEGQLHRGSLHLLRGTFRLLRREAAGPHGRRGIRIRLRRGAGHGRVRATRGEGRRLLRRRGVVRQERPATSASNPGPRPAIPRAPSSSCTTPAESPMEIK